MAQKIYLTAGDDTYDNQFAFDLAVYGKAGNDVFSVSGQKSAFYGQTGNDEFRVYDSIDFIPQKNIFDGSLGIDTLTYEVFVENYRGSVINLDKGYAYRTGFPALKDKLVSIENVNALEGKDQIIGNAVANVLSGGADDDTLKGLGGNDTLYGDGGPVYTYADGNDRLTGGTGNDILIGQGGADILQGDSGADTFRYLQASDSTVAYRDTIKDFNARQKDIIDLKAVDANENARGDQSFDFIGNRAFSGKAGELNFRSGLLSGDTDGDRVADFQIKLMGVTSLSAGDFLL